MRAAGRGVLLGGLLAAPLFVAVPARAQEPGGPAGPPPAAAAAPPTPDQDGLVVDAPIVAGNVANARRKALADVRRLAVERAFAQLLIEQGFGPGAPMPAPLASLKVNLATNAERYVRSYRLLEQGEVEGYFRLRAQVDVDTGALRREVERARGPAGPGRALLVLVAGPPEAATAVTEAIAATGLKADVQVTPSADAAQARTLAAQGGRNAALLVTASLAEEGPVRGTAVRAFACRLSTRTIAGGAVGPEAEAEGRGFHADPAAARAACLGPLAARVMPEALAALGPAASGATEARVLGLVLDLVEPASLAPVLRGLRKIGAVSASEVRRVQVGRIELRVVTRLSAEELVAALRRELGATVAVTPLAVEADRAALEVRLVAPAAGPDPGATADPAGPAPGGTP
jgi:hypothetical protein